MHLQQACDRVEEPCLCPCALLLLLYCTAKLLTGTVVLYCTLHSFPSPQLPYPMSVSMSHTSLSNARLADNHERRNDHWTKAARRSAAGHHWARGQSIGGANIVSGSIMTGDHCSVGTVLALGVPVAEAKRVRREGAKLWALLEPLSDSTVQVHYLVWMHGYSTR